MRVEIWAHRGHHTKDFPENSLEAIRSAIEYGADGVEIDVQRTKDGELVVIHDEYLERLTGLNKFIWEVDYEDLKTLYILNSDKKITECHVPKLTDVLDLFVGEKTKLNIEIKDSFYPYDNLPAEVVKEVAARDLQEQIIYSSFNHNTIKYFVDQGLGDYSGFLYGEIIYDPAAYAKSIGAKYIHPSGSNMLLDNYVEDTTAAGFALNVWTLNSDEHIKFALEKNINAIITDEMIRAMQIRDVFISQKEG